MMKNEQLQAARLARGWTRKDAADACGVGERSIRRWELGEGEPSLPLLKQLTKGFGLSAKELGYEHLLRLKSESRQMSDQADEAEIRAAVVVEAVSPSSIGEDDQFLSSISLNEAIPSQYSEPAIYEDSAAWFGVRLTRILTLVIRTVGRHIVEVIRHQAMIDQEIRMLDEIQPYITDDAFVLSRRQALVTLATLPTTLLATIRSGQWTSALIEEFLPSCSAGITSCWHLMNGQEIVTVEGTLSRYLPAVFTLARSPSRYQQSFALLGAQGALLQGLVALHRLPAPRSYQARLASCKQAVELARVSGDRSLLILALIHLASMYYDLDQPAEMVRLDEEAVRLSRHPDVSALLQAKALDELAWAYGYMGNAQEALRCIGEARAVLPEHSGEIPIYLPDSGPFLQLMMESQAFQDLAKHSGKREYHVQAWDALEQINGTSTIVVPERFMAEVLNQKAAVALRLGNLEQWRSHLIAGAVKAKALGSDKRRQEVVANWKAARQQWPREIQVLELADLLVE